jgi:limonene 1,2-monooxygenase
MHVAETEAEALENCRYGLERVFDYLSHVVPTGPVTATTYEGRVKEMNASGAAVIGTPEMAVAQIQRLVDQSGGFGCYMLLGHHWADPAATRRSLELMARYVMPEFQGSNQSMLRAVDRALAKHDPLFKAQQDALAEMTARHQSEVDERERQ